MQALTLNAGELTVLDLGPVPGQNRSEARGINQFGQVAGFSSGPFPVADAFVWNGFMNHLAGLEGIRSFGFDINELGQVAGQVSLASAGFRANAMVWTPATGPIQLSTEFSQARALNSSGLAVGHSGGRAVRWDFVNGGSTDLGDLGGGGADAFDINESGAVVGFSTDASGARRAFLWTEQDGMMDLGVLTGEAESEARAINRRNRIAGLSGSRPFLWTQQGGLFELENLPGSDLAIAEDINEFSVIVGTASGDEDVAFAVVWVRRQIRDLNGFLPANTPWERLQNALAINDVGDVVGIGIIRGEFHGFLALNVPSVVESSLAIRSPAPPGAWSGRRSLRIDRRPGDSSFDPPDAARLHPQQPTNRGRLLRE